MGVLVNPYRFGGASLIDSFVGYSESTLNASSYTFTDHDIGTANGSRLVVVGVALFTSGTNAITGVTIGGSAATEVTNMGTSGTARTTAIYSRVVAAGTTATIVVNCTSSANSCGIAVGSIYPSSTTAIEAVSGDTGASTSLTNAAMSVQAGGFLFAISMHNNSNSTTWTWGGTGSVSEQLDENLGDSGINWSVATLATSVTESPSLAASWTGSVNAALSMASWGP